MNFLNQPSISTPEPIRSNINMTCVFIANLLIWFLSVLDLKPQRRKAVKKSPRQTCPKAQRETVFVYRGGVSAVPERILWQDCWEEITPTMKTDTAVTVETEGAVFYGFMWIFESDYVLESIPTSQLYRIILFTSEIHAVFLKCWNVPLHEL